MPLEIKFLVCSLDLRKICNIHSVYISNPIHLLGAEILCLTLSMSCKMALLIFYERKFQAVYRSGNGDVYCE